MKRSGRKTEKAWPKIAGLTAALLLASCVSIYAASKQPDPAYFYGKGTGATVQEAGDAARADLAAKALADSVGASAESFVLTKEMSLSVKLPEMKPLAVEKGKGRVSVTYRLAKAEWAKLESTRQAAIRSEAAARFSSLRGSASMTLNDKVAEASRLLDTLSLEGVSGVLTETESGSALMSGAIGEYCEALVSGLRFAVEPEGGFIDYDTSFAIRLESKDGALLAATPISIVWKAGNGKSAASASSLDAGGAASASFTQDEALAGQKVTLALSTAFASREPGSAFLRSLDEKAARSFSYRHFDDIQKAFLDEARVAGGDFILGAVKQDRRAGRKEAPRPAAVADFYMDRYPVTNALYRAFLEDTGASPSDYPSYWDNPDYNKPDQPVVGVSLADAERFAAWVSERIGKAKRLPSRGGVGEGGARGRGRHRSLGRPEPDRSCPREL